MDEIKAIYKVIRVLSEFSSLILGIAGLIGFIYREKIKKFFSKRHY